MNKQKIKWSDYVFKVLIILLLMLTALLPIFTLTSQFSSAEDSTYSNVLEDLQKDENFNVEDYPVIADNYSLEVIQIAESVNKELFVYVYQPSGNRKATSINISTEIDENLSFVNYNLIYLNSNNTIYKYKVEELEIKDLLIRYYEISSIFRAWDASIDKLAEGENIVNEVSFNVGKAYSFTDDGINSTMYCQDIETIEVVDKYVGFVRYRNGFILERDSCDSHFVAFSTNKKIDNLMQIEMSFLADFTNEIMPWENKTTKYQFVISEEDNFSYSPLWQKKIIRDRIVSTVEFIKEENLTDDAKKNIIEKQFVLRFFETSYSYANSMYNPKNEYTRVSDVTLLRFKYETEGKVYNIGVVDNKQTGTSEPVNKSTWPWWAWLLLALVVLVLVLVLVVIFFPQLIVLFIKAIWFVIKNFVEGVWWLITAPFSLFFDD